MGAVEKLERETKEGEEEELVKEIPPPNHCHTIVGCCCDKEAR
jgi:hypothetical protein